MRASGAVGRADTIGSMRLVLVLLAAASCHAADLKIDHVTAAGADLKQLQAKLQAAGIPSVYGGPHTNRATEMALVSFPDGSYLELLGIQPNADANAVAKYEWSAFLRGDAGPCAWAVRERNLPAEVARLRSVGVKVSEPVPGGRRRPDGVQLQWQTSNIGEETRGVFFPFAIQDVTPRDRRAYPKASR